MIGWAWFAAGFYLGITAAAWVYEEWRGWVGQRRRVAETWAWLDDGADWLYDSQIDQTLEQR